MDFNFSVSSLFAGFVFGVIGFYLIKEGRRHARVPYILIGLVMLVYPYFVENDYLVWGIGAVLTFAAYRMRRW